MQNRLAVFNQKGGVGKTTTVLNLGAALARCGRVPVLIDLDAQAHLSSILSPVASGEESLFAFFNQTKSLTALARGITLAGASGELLPAHAELIKVDTLFGKGPGILNRLKSGLDKTYGVADELPSPVGGWTSISRAADVAAPSSESSSDSRPLLIDCCPMLGVLSLSAVFATERLLIPISTDFLAMRGALQLENTLRAMEHVLKKRVERRYLLTRFDARRRMSHDIAAQAAERFGAELCQTRIAENVSVAESPARGQDIFRHAPASRGAKDYETLIDELLASGFWEI